MNLSLILLQAASQGSQLIQTVIFLAGIIIVFYFFMVRPNQKKQKNEKKFREALKKGDKVVTIGGIHGKIASLQENTVLIDVDKGTKLLVEKESISAQVSQQYQSAQES